jgi:hypothetical protein
MEIITGVAALLAFITYSFRKSIQQAVTNTIFKGISCLCHQCDI